MPAHAGGLRVARDVGAQIRVRQLRRRALPRPGSSVGSSLFRRVEAQPHLRHARVEVGERDLFLARRVVLPGDPAVVGSLHPDHRLGLGVEESEHDPGIGVEAKVDEPRLMLLRSPGPWSEGPRGGEETCKVTVRRPHEQLRDRLIDPFEGRRAGESPELRELVAVGDAHLEPASSLEREPRRRPVGGRLERADRARLESPLRGIARERHTAGRKRHRRRELPLLHPIVFGGDVGRVDRGGDGERGKQDQKGREQGTHGRRPV